MSERINTKLIHGANEKVTEAREVNVPIYLTATFTQKSFEDHSGYGYARGNNPTREALETLIAKLEGGKASFAFASGMAASSAAFSLFNSGDKILVPGAIYGGTYDVLKDVFTRFGIEYEIINSGDLDELEARITDNVKGIFFETPSNPTLKVIDIRKVVEIAKKKNILTILDNTFMSPYLQRPLELGIDIVVESATKYLGGHSDIIAGIVAVNDLLLAERLHKIQAVLGGIIQPFDAYQLIRSIKTLGVRLDRQVSNAEKIAEFLVSHKAVKAVHYLGLKTDPGYEIQKSQAKNGGAMISFEITDEYCPAKFLDGVKIFTHGASLGGVESLIGHPGTSSHRSLSPDLQKEIGIYERTIRLSPGIEDVEDLIEDLDQALINAKL